MKLINTNKENCVKCKKCSVVCPMEIIVLDENGFPEPIVDAFKLCINCGYCVDICDFDALMHKVRKRNTTTKAANRRYEAQMKIRRGESIEK